MKANTGITNSNSPAVPTELSKILLDEYVVFTKTKKGHWNAEGADVYDKHKFFEGQYEEPDEFTHPVAERIRVSGPYAPATLTSFSELTSLREASCAKNDTTEFIKEPVADHEAIITRLRENINRFANEYYDLGASDFITGLIEEHNRMAWLLCSHL